jgi:hypothetical protein
VSFLIKLLTRMGLLKDDLDYHLLRASKKVGILGALGSCVVFVGTVTIIPFFPNGWAASAGGFPAMTGDVAFLLKDVALLAVSIYLLRQDVLRVASDATLLAASRDQSCTRL